MERFGRERDTESDGTDEPLGLVQSNFITGIYEEVDEDVDLAQVKYGSDK